jgi:hypothetical protein
VIQELDSAGANLDLPLSAQAAVHRFISGRHSWLQPREPPTRLRALARLNPEAETVENEDQDEHEHD